VKNRRVAHEIPILHDEDIDDLAKLIDRRYR
jgi:hypothetical protein